MYSACTLFLMSMWLLNTVASPFAASLEARAVPCDKIDKYTTQFFIGSRLFDPDDSTCQFYTAKQGELAQLQTLGNDLISLWDVWPCNLYDDRRNDDNPLRCILDKTKPDRQTYFENMSRAYAQLCKGHVTVWTPDVQNIPTDGIWARVEFPELMRTTNFDSPLGQVDIIEAESTDNGKIRGLFDRNPTPKRRSLPGLTNRDAPGNRPECIPAEDIESRFGDINW